jgi:hypothetical protein
MEISDMVFTGTGVKIYIHLKGAQKKEGEEQEGIERVAPFPTECQEEQDQRRDQADLNEKVGNSEEIGAGDSRHESYQERNDRSGHARPPFQFPGN